jgi:hypothetical protein
MAERVVPMTRDGGAQADLSRAYNDAWYDRGTKVVETLRTSLVIDPPDGKIPRKGQQPAGPPPIISTVLALGII